jgi:O-antigen/teichoic acid export membrane protein
MISFKTILRQDDRSSRFKKNTIVLLFCQLSSIGLSLVLVPLTLGYLGIKEYGVWITLVGIIEWFNFFDIGLGHGLRNKYAESKAHGNAEDLKRYVSTAFFTMVFISSFIFIFFCSISPFLNWAVLINAPAQLAGSLQTLALLLMGMFCLRFIVNIVSVLLTADQNPAIPGIIILTGSILSLFSIYVLTLRGETSLLSLGFFFSLSQIIPLLIAFFYFFSTRYKSILPRWKYFSKKHIRSIFSLGGRFFLIQVTALLLFQSNNIIIAHISGQQDVTNFNIAFRYLNILFTVFMTMLTPLWSASTDAYARGDIDWIEKCIARLNKIWLLLILLGIAMVILSPVAYHLWLKGKLLPNTPLLIVLLLYFLFLMRSTLYRSFMNGVGKIRMQFYVTFVQAILHIPLAALLGKEFGVVGVVATMLLWAVINAAWEPIQYKKIIANTAKGIWSK